MPPAFTTNRLDSWARTGDAVAERFAGTARYTTTFDAPTGARSFRLDLGTVAQSARVRVNGRDCGTTFTPPFRAAE